MSERLASVMKRKQRYIAFVIEGSSTDRKDMINKIRNNFSYDEYQEVSPWLTVFTGDKGIVRCNHDKKEKAVKILNSIKIGDGEVKTITTSGTIKKAKKRLFEND